MVEEIVGLLFRVRAGRTVLARGFADRHDAEQWLASVQAVAELEKETT